MRVIRPPYISAELFEQMKNRDYFYKKAKSGGNEDDWLIAKHLRNQTNKNIRKAKSAYIADQLDNHKNDSAKFWRVIKGVFPSGSQKVTSQIKLKKGDDIVHLDNGRIYR